VPCLQACPHRSQESGRPPRWRALPSFRGDQPTRPGRRVKPRRPVTGSRDSIRGRRERVDRTRPVAPAARPLVLLSGASRSVLAIRRRGSRWVVQAATGLPWSPPHEEKSRAGKKLPRRTTLRPARWLGRAPRASPSFVPHSAASTARRQGRVVKGASSRERRQGSVVKGASSRERCRRPSPLSAWRASSSSGCRSSSPATPPWRRPQGTRPPGA
jgi:hypothetical protein